MSSNFFLKSFRILLLPLSIIYWLVIWVRNKCYDNKIFASTSFALPVICIGNLSVGGTGKSPMVEYLVRLLKDQFRIATLSRGYKRRTKGYALANEKTTALDIGDEPMQFHLKFPGVPVAVGEERLVAIPQLLHDRPDTQAIILDDAFQHRAVQAGLNILLTSYSNPYTRDFYLPTGDLRDLKASAKRASVLIVTKCPDNLSEKEKGDFIKELNAEKHQSIFFTSIVYDTPYHIITSQEENLNANGEILLVTGIANPDPLKLWVEERSSGYQMIEYPDHHIFTIDDLKEIRSKFRKMESPEKIILTTEKDAVRLVKFRAELADLPIYVVPVRHHFLFSEENQFNQLVINFIKGFK